MLRVACLLSLLVLIASPMLAITVGQVDTFDGGTDGWTSGGSNPNPPTAAAGVLTITATGGNGAGSRLIAFNRSQWAGDYAGVTSVEIEARNPNAVALQIRFAVNGPGGWWVTTAHQLAPGASFETFELSLRPEDLTGVSGATDVNATLAGVTEARLLHNPTVSRLGAVINAQLLVNMIEAKGTGSGTACTDDPEALCLRDDRFQVKVTWADFNGNTGTGMPVTQTADTGAFWFFDSQNLELIVKVLDGQSFNGNYWVFYGSLTSVSFTLTVTDLDTGNMVTYSNELGNFASQGDISALPGDP
ncbi:MAG: hypothetical protein AAGD38_05855 [Acidobacteriota bacterium]